MVVDYGYYNLISILLAAGADVNVEDNNGKTPLHLAIDRERFSKNGLGTKLFLDAPGLNVSNAQKALDMARAINYMEITTDIQKVIEQQARWNPLRQAWVGATVRAGFHRYGDHRPIFPDTHAGDAFFTPTVNQESREARSPV
jgi:ankyrin repeat protein